MQKAPIPQEENLRLQDLLSHHILESGEEESYDELLEIAAQICDCPQALISLVDKDRQWFKSKINIADTELPRETSFCGHAINYNDVFIVEDAAKDARFHDNPYVTGDPNIKFYAGAQIVSKSGFNLGTVCVIDNKSKTITEQQKETLRKVASQISKMMEAKKKDAQIKRIADNIRERKKENDQNFEMLFMQSSFPKIIFGADGFTIMDANDAALKLYGYTRETFIGLTALDIRANKSKEQMLKSISKADVNETPVSLKAKHLTRDGKALYVVIDFSTVFFKGQEAKLANITDVTEEKHLSNKLKDEREKAERKILAAAIKVKQKEKDNITDALRENINQILACTNLYLSIAQTDPDKCMDLVQKSQKNILLAMEEIKKLYRPVQTSAENGYLKEAVEQLVLKYELLRSFNIHYHTEGEELNTSLDVKMQVYRIVDQYFDTALRTPGLKNVWVTITFGEEVELLIKNDNSQPDSKKRKMYLQKLREELVELDGTADLYECADISCTLHVKIPGYQEVVKSQTDLCEEAVLMD